jgi:hypothetical protein
MSVLEPYEPYISKIKKVVNMGSASSGKHLALTATNTFLSSMFVQWIFPPFSRQPSFFLVDRVLPVLPPMLARCPIFFFSNQSRHFSNQTEPASQIPEEG